MVRGKRNIFNKHIDTSRTSLSTQRTLHLQNFRRENTDSFDQATESDPSNETESQDGTLREDLNADSQYLRPDDDKLNIDIGTNQEMKDVEMRELEMDNVFLSLVQDVGEKGLEEPWVAVGTQLTDTHGCSAQPPLKLPPLETQFIVVLKGIGAETYECLKLNLQEADDSRSNQVLKHTRRYLKELTSARVDYVDKNGKRKRVGMQNIPLVYGNSMLGSENWARHRPMLEDGW